MAKSKAKSTELEVGDVVKPESGEGEMTVRSYEKGMVTCDWLDDENQPVSGSFAEGQLELVRRAKQKEKSAFGSPDWIDENVIPLGERGAKLWRSLSATHKDNPAELKRDWAKFSKDIERLSKAAEE